MANAKTLSANGGTPSPKPVAVKPEDMEKTVAGVAAPTSKPIKTKTNELGTAYFNIKKGHRQFVNCEIWYPTELYIKLRYRVSQCCGSE